MKISIKKSVFYLFATLIIFAGQFLINNGQLTGKPPKIEQQTLAGQDAMKTIHNTPSIIYFWAEWCGICKMMQATVSAVTKDTSIITVAVKSGDAEKVASYLKENSLNWKVVNDPLGKMADQYKVKGVPAVFFLDQTGEIQLTASGYISEIGLRFRLWLADAIYKKISTKDTKKWLPT